LCEIKYKHKPVGIEIIKEVERKTHLLEQKSHKTIQKILISQTLPTQNLIKQGFFYKIITANQLFISDS
jgi:hypothetical protein